MNALQIHLLLEEIVRLGLLVRSEDPNAVLKLERAMRRILEGDPYWLPNGEE